MKLTFIVIILMLSICILFACASPAGDYENFLLDMDVITRFDICFSKISDNDTSSYTKAELNALIQDLASWKSDYQIATEANDLFSQAARCLIDSIEYMKIDDWEQSEISYNLANDFYQNAQAEITKAHTGG